MVGKICSIGKLSDIDWNNLPLMCNEKEAAAILNVSVSFLRLSRCEGERRGRTPGPKFVKINGSVRYKITELRRWVEDPPERIAI